MTNGILTIVACQNMVNEEWGMLAKARNLPQLGARAAEPHGEAPVISCDIRKPEEVGKERAEASLSCAGTIV